MMAGTAGVYSPPRKAQRGTWRLKHAAGELFALAVVAAFLVFLGGYLWGEAVFATREVRFEGNEHLTDQQILEAAQIDPTTRVRDLDESQVTRLREYIDRNYQVEGDLRREVNMNIKRLMEIGCYRGLRHRRNLPVRGQSTRTNARTRRGVKKTVAGKKRARK